MDASSTAQVPISEFQRCNSCHTMKSVGEEHFKARADGNLFKTCGECLDKKKKARLNKLRLRNANKENLTQASEEGSDDRILSPPLEYEDSALFQGMKIVKLDAFVQTLLKTGGKIDVVTAKVNVSGTEASSSRDMADKVAKAIWECSGYRFIYHSFYMHKLSLSSKFRYYCAQMYSRQRTNKDCESIKERRKPSMQTFQCHGWLFMTVYQELHVVEVSVQHKEKHVPYRCIDVPPAVHEFLKDNPGISFAQLWKKILEMDPAPGYSRKAMRQYRIAMGRQSDDKMETRC
ncbi:hypothetical protein JR316_0002950 [Psilocybe cubensis]|uniref:Uncharacterized protein n=2 Tax=Psilocybe cubensis TaxID=181762 RepID=A0A8H7XZW1_PSICU|nr:hypothetical protein JR316_0002950 [Psilocybe cubensis]KAH9483482.1 hypothetical protein JR316_0002950 [Psilocybe cubensis]